MIGTVIRRDKIEGDKRNKGKKCSDEVWFYITSIVFASNVSSDV